MTDASAHFGGLLVGFLVTCALFAYEAETENQRKWIPIVCISVTATYFVLGFILFYTVVKV
jgi:biotin transporter BioY